MLFIVAILVATPAELQRELRENVAKLANEIGERNTEHPLAYERAARWIESQLGGYAVHRESGNIVAELRGASSEIVIAGAHYDSAVGTPGADDNASGVAALLALAHHFAKTHPQRTVRFVFFANEEPPYFQTEQMGSLIYARACASRREKIVAMLRRRETSSAS